MFDTRKISEYIGDTGIAEISDSRSYNIKKILSYVSIYEEKIGKDFIDFSEKDCADMLSERCRTGVDLSCYKSEIKSYLLWYANRYKMERAEATLLIDKVKKVSSKAISKNPNTGSSIALSYFSSQEKFITFLENFNDPYFYDIRALLILYWFGFTREEIILLKRDSLDDSLLAVSGKIIGEPFFSMVKDYASLEKIKGLRKTPHADYSIEIRYCVGDYLFRVPMSKEVLEKKENSGELNQPVTFSYLSKSIMGKIRKKENISDKKLKSQYLHINKLFIDIHNEEVKSGKSVVDVGTKTKTILDLPENIAKILNENGIYKNGNFLKLYVYWRNYYYKNQ